MEAVVPVGRSISGAIIEVVLETERKVPGKQRHAEGRVGANSENQTFPATCGTHRLPFLDSNPSPYSVWCSLTQGILGLLQRHPVLEDA